MKSEKKHLWSGHEKKPSKKKSKRINTHAKSGLAHELKAGALANRERDVRIAEEWFPLEEEVATKYLDDIIERKRAFESKKK